MRGASLSNAPVASETFANINERRWCAPCRGWISGRTFRREETTQNENNKKKKQQPRARRVLSLRGREGALRKEAQEGSTTALINIQRDQAQESRFGCGNNWALKASRVLKVPGSSQARTKGNEGVFLGRRPIVFLAGKVLGKGRLFLAGRVARRRIRTTTVARSQVTVVPCVERGRERGRGGAETRRLSCRKNAARLWPLFPSVCPPSSPCSSFSSSSLHLPRPPLAPLPLLASPVERYAAIGHSWPGSMMLLAC